ncbi:uncharacterized protein LOC112495109 [Cephus cinctus]|uniref:Gustatory receptor n=1 Tax=Cephus cinctus TaxID=211228 RepID=A0AAJ7RRM4_CEPCN|nr:uncharacterized protein LOC112495109 [Cephus cinctus]
MKQPLKTIVMQSIMTGVLLNDEKGKYLLLGLSFNMINNLLTIFSIISILYYLTTGEVILLQKFLQGQIIHQQNINTLNDVQLITQLSVRLTVLVACWIRRKLLLRSINSANVILESMGSSYCTKKSYMPHCLAFPIFLILRILEATNWTVDRAEYKPVEILGHGLLLWANLITDVVMIHYAALAYCVKLALKNINDHISQKIMASTRSENPKDQQVNVSAVPYYSYFQSREIMPVLNGVESLINVKSNKISPNVTHRGNSHIGYSDTMMKFNRRLSPVQMDIKKCTKSGASSTIKSQEAKKAPLYRIIEFLGYKNARRGAVKNAADTDTLKYFSKRPSHVGTKNDNSHQILELMYRYINIEALVNNMDSIYRVQLMSIFWNARICGILVIHSLFSDILSGHPANMKRLLIVSNSLAVLFLPLLHVCDQAESAVRESWQTRTALLAVNSGRASKDFNRSVDIFVGQVETIPIHFDVGLGKAATLREFLSLLISTVTTVIVMIQFSSSTSATASNTTSVTNFTSLPDYSQSNYTEQSLLKNYH